MKKIISKILIISMLFLGVGGFLAIPETAQAACSIGEVTVGNGLSDCIFEAAVGVVMPIVAKFLQLAAYLFDHALTLNMNIAQFLQQPTCQQAGCDFSPVEVVWRLIRDISGMFFIFILIFSSIKMILSGDNNKGVIIGVIIAGLLVNFSLFATKIIIDASNTLTLTIYTAISPTQAAATLKDSTIGGTFGFAGDIYGKAGTVSSKIMQVVNLQSLFASTQGAAKNANFTVSGIVTIVGGVVLMLVLGLAFLAAGVMFLWRFIMLLALMAASPIPALAYAFPGLKGISSWFSKELIAQCTFAPIFLFTLYIALKVLTSGAFIALAGSKNSSFASLFSGMGGGIAPLIQYGLVIFIIFGGLVAAKNAGGKGGEFGINGIKALGKWGQGAIRGATVGVAANTVGWAGRKTLGAAADGLGKDFDKLEARVANSPLKFLSNNDLTRGISKNLKAAKEGGYGGRTPKELEEAEKGRKKELQEVTKRGNYMTTIDTHLKSTAPGSHDELKKVLSKMNIKDIESLKGKILDPKIAAQFSSKQAEAILKSDNVSDADKDTFKEKRAQGIADVSTSFKYSDIESILKEDLSEDQKKSIKESRTKALQDALAAGNDALTGEIMKNMNGKEITKMFDKVPHTPGGAHPLLVKHLKISHLEDMKDLDSDWKKEIGDEIDKNNKHHGHGWVNSNAQKGTWIT